MKIDPGEVADRFLAAYNNRRPDEAAALYDDEGWHADAAAGQRKVGPEAVEKGLAHFLSAVPDASWTEIRRIVAGHEILVVYELNGRFTGRLGPFEGTGQQIQLPGAFALSITQEGKIASSVDYWDPRVFTCQAQPGKRENKCI